MYKTAVHHAIVKQVFTARERTGQPRVRTSEDEYIMLRIAVRSISSYFNKIKAEFLAVCKTVSLMAVYKCLIKAFGI